MSFWWPLKPSVSKLPNPANMRTGSVVNRFSPKSRVRKLPRPSKSPAFKLVNCFPCKDSVSVTLAKFTAVQSSATLVACKMASRTSGVRSHMLEVSALTGSVAAISTRTVSSAFMLLSLFELLKRPLLLRVGRYKRRCFKLPISANKGSSRVNPTRWFFLKSSSCRLVSPSNTPTGSVVNSLPYKDRHIKPSKA